MSRHYTPAWVTWIWRRLYAQGNCTHVNGSRNEWYIDAGYCLDRYSIENEEGVVTLSRP